MAEQDRVERAAAALRERIPYLCAPSHEYVARVALAAADAADEPTVPKWPTDESVMAYFDTTETEWLKSRYDESQRERLADAFRADPIIKAAIEWYHSHAANSYYLNDASRDLLACIRNSGVLDG